MFRVILHNEWKWSRWFVSLGTIAAFGLPILSVQTAGARGATPSDVLGAIQSWSVLYPVLAGALGLLAGMAAWAPDHRGRHIYALVLPLPRWRYVLLRFSGGLTLLALPAAGVTLGAILATVMTTIPSGLYGYPLTLALRFALALLVAYSMFFAISAGTARTAGVILSVAALLIVVQMLASAADLDWPIAQTVMNRVFDWPGPLAIFTRRWMLIDV
jgi:hypothetical protein